MRANLHLHGCKLRPPTGAPGETAAQLLQGQGVSERQRERESTSKDRTLGWQIKEDF